MTDKLFEPYQLGPNKLSNRVAMSPMTRGRAGEDHVPDDLMVEYYVQRAGTGLIISEGVSIDPTADGWVHAPGIHNEAMIAGWRRVTDAVHAAGGKMFAQLWHCGRASHSSFLGGNKPVAPSAIAISQGEAHTPEGKQPYQVPRELATDEIPAIVAMYGQAAANAKAAGFDGVEYHGANGYLPDSFLQSKTNERIDQYGGSVENRYRFVGECLDSILQHYDADRVGLKISPNGEFNDMGSSDYREQFLYVASQAQKLNLVYLDIMIGLGFGFHKLGTPMTLAEFREVYDGCIMTNVGYDKDSSIRDVESGDADMVAIGRPLISNPDLVNRWRSGQPTEDDAPVDVWYSPGSEGYTTYPSFAESKLNPAV